MSEKKRCLLIDNHHIERTQGLRRRMHQPKKHETPVLIPEKPWETCNDGAGFGIGAWCAPVRDPKSGQWKMWYWGNAAGAEAKKRIEPMYAGSDDGINWRRPNLGQVEFDGDCRNNMLFTHGSAGENILEAIADPNDADYPCKAVTRRRTLLRSRDGITWELLDAQGPPSDDTYRLTFDHLQNRYIMTVKHTQNRPDTGKYVRGRYPVPEYGRSAAVSVSEDFQKWTEPELVFAADETDWQQGADRIAGIVAAQGNLMQGPIYTNDPAEYRTEIYSLPVFPYEDMYLALPEIFNVSGVQPHPEKNNALKQNGVLYGELAASRDLRNWTRLGDRAPFIPLSPVGGGMFDQGLIVPAGPPVLNNDELWFYYTGTRFGHASALARCAREQQAGVKEAEPSSGIFLARLRRDGFISMRADDEPGVLLTRVVEVTGSRLHVNVDAEDGELRAEIRDARTGRAIPGYSLGNRYPHRFNATERQTCGAEIDAAPDTSMPLTEDILDGAVHWQAGDDLSGLRGKLVRIQFYLRRADLFSFWFGD